MTNTMDEALTSIYHSFLTIYVLLDDGDRQALQAERLTPSQFNLLSRLENETTGLTVTKLADQLLCTRGNITRMVQRLKKRELIHVKTDELDQRRLRITLTIVGKEVLMAASQAHIISLQRRFAALDPAQRQQLASLLPQVSSILEADLTQD